MNSRRPRDNKADCAGTGIKVDLFHPKVFGQHELMSLVSLKGPQESESH